MLRYNAKGTAGLSLKQNVVYSYPSISSLASHIADIVSGHPQADHLEAQAFHVNHLIERYTSAIPDVQCFLSSEDHNPVKESVLITGTTGALGGYMLAHLMSDDWVERIWAINRPAVNTRQTLAERHKASFSIKGIDARVLDIFAEKVVFIEADLTKADFGLDKSTLDSVGEASIPADNLERLTDFTLPKDTCFCNYYHTCRLEPQL